MSAIAPQTTFQAQTIRGRVAAGHPKTAEAGAEMLRLGGNVFDAVVAAVLTACVAESTLTSLAGGGFLLAHTAQGEDILFDFFTQTPRIQKDTSLVNFYPVGVDFGSVVQEFHIGLGSMAVPGTCAGLFHVHRRLGRLPFATVAEPAIHFAKTGTTVTEFQAFCYSILKPILMASQEMRQICAPNGDLLQPGETLTIPAMADTLSYLVEAGSQAFYEGEIAQQIVKDCAEQGGYLTLEDLKHYQVIERSPLITTYRGNQLLTNPPPSSGGTLIAFALKLLEQVNVQAFKFGSTAHLQLLADVMRLTNAARADGYDARLYEENVGDRFLSPEHLTRYAQKLAFQNAPLNKWGSTTHISAIDAEGNAASVTSSNGEGSSYVIPGTGVMVNNMLGEADLHPGGFHEWQPNVRISSMMAPTLVLRDRRPEIVLGSGGSNRIRTAILQVISNILDFEMPVEEAVNRPRVHWENQVFNLEPGFSKLEVDRSQFPFDQEVIFWDTPSMFFGGVHTVMQDETGAISGSGDQRRSGAIA